MSKSYTIDSVVRSSLMDAGFPLHYYFRTLHYALRGLRELSFDHPLNIKEVRLDVTDYGAVIVPTDFVDSIRLGVEVGDKVRPLAIDNNLNGIYKYDSSGNKVKYSDDVVETEVDVFTALDQDHKVNSHGEYVGRHFGYVGTARWTYKFIRERDEIQLNASLAQAKVILWYISDGVSLSTANVIHPYAAECLTDYINWQRAKHDFGLKPNGYTTLQARRDFYNSKRKLRGRLDDTGTEEIILAGRRMHFALKN